MPCLVNFVGTNLWNSKRVQREPSESIFREVLVGRELSKGPDMVLPRWYCVEGTVRPMLVEVIERSRRSQGSEAYFASQLPLWNVQIKRSLFSFVIPCSNWFIFGPLEYFKNEGNHFVVQNSRIQHQNLKLKDYTMLKFMNFKVWWWLN